MNIAKFVVSSLLVMASLVSFAQGTSAQSDSMKQAKYRTEIGFDMSVPDFETTQIDVKVMGPRLAGILDYLMENYHQSVYGRKLCQIL